MQRYAYSHDTKAEPAQEIDESTATAAIAAGATKSQFSDGTDTWTVIHTDALIAKTAADREAARLQAVVNKGEVTRFSLIGALQAAGVWAEAKAVLAADPDTEDMFMAARWVKYNDGGMRAAQTALAASNPTAWTDEKYNEYFINAYEAMDPADQA